MRHPSYDSERRPVSVSGGVSATYDALGRLVEYNNGSSYTQTAYTPSGTKFAYMNGQSVQQYFAPLAGGAQIVYNASGIQFYRLPDWEGTSRFAVTPSNSVYFDGGYAPFGEQYASYGTSDRVFTGQQQELVSALYDFPFRQYSSTQGRWIVPDPAGLAAVDITNPQTWNRYAYVANNPLSYIDPLGLILTCGDPAQGADDPYCDGAEDGGSGGGDDCTSVAPCTITVTGDPDPPSLYDGSNGSGCGTMLNGACLLTIGGVSYNIGGGSGQFQLKNPFRVKNCPVSFSQRAQMFGNGVLNLAIATAKVTFAAGVEGGTSGLATALALHSAYSASGNLASALIQAVGAWMPNAAQWQQAATISSAGGSISGLMTLALTVLLTLFPHLRLSQQAGSDAHRGMRDVPLR